jgi:hypothetical protein
MQLRWRSAALVGPIMTAMLLGTCTHVGAASPGWTIQNSPNASNHEGNLGALTCTSAANCVAVGDDGARALVERWNGHVWKEGGGARLSTGKTSTLAAVSCWSAAGCMAVGHYNSGSSQKLLAEVYNGKGWAVRTAPSIKGGSSFRFFGVSCVTSRFCLVVGDYLPAGGSTHALVERWNGKRWAVYDFSLTPSEQATYTSFSSVSCASTTSCMAVGSTSIGFSNVVTAYAYYFNGSGFVPTTAADPIEILSSEYDSVSCSAATYCLAVGTYQDRSYGFWAQEAAQWNGHRWKLVDPAKRAGEWPYAGLDAVSCIAKDDCLAVGGENTGGDAYAPGPLTALAQRWNGHHWATQKVPGRDGLENYLRGISCPRVGSCTAAGASAPVDNDTSGPFPGFHPRGQTTLIERYH